MRHWKQSRLSRTQRTEVWSRWKSGQSLKEIGRAFGKRLVAFTVCWCLAEGFLQQFVGDLVYPSLWLRERMFLEGSLPAGPFVR